MAAWPPLILDTYPTGELVAAGGMAGPLIIGVQNPSEHCHARPSGSMLMGPHGPSTKSAFAVCRALLASEAMHAKALDLADS